MNIFNKIAIKKSLFSLLLLPLFFSCKEKLTTSKIARANANYYHWKIDANLDKKEKEALKIANTQKVYLHYFDVVKEGYNEKPIAVIREVDEVLKAKEIVPVIFIRSSLFEEDNFYGDYLSRKILDLATQIHEHHFNDKPKEIQIDCDWTASSKTNYFKFLTNLSKKIKVSATIRLHQIKYKDKTGVPPVNYGALMVYNVGDLKNKKENSILQANTVAQYISENTKYPLPLDIALPIYSQIVVFNNNSSVKLINEPDFGKIKTDTEHFEKQTETLYKVKKKVLYKGQYLYKGFTLKLEESNIDEVVESYKTIKNSSLITSNLILYHLDEATLNQFNLSELLEKLK